MWKRLKIVLQFILFAVIGVNSSKRVITVTKCKRSDVNCVTTSSQEVLQRFADGIPEYRVEPMDPMFFKYVDISYPNLKVVARNITAKGVRSCYIRRMEIKDSTMFMKMACNLTLDGMYEMAGRILTFPVKGKGKLYAVLNNVHFDGEADVVEVIGKDKEKHWKVKGYRRYFKLTEKAHLELQNLTTTEFLSQSFKYLLDNNPNVLVSVLGDNALGEVAKVTFINVQHFFQAIPLKDLTLD